MSNLYYHPEEYDLEQVYNCDYGASYEFDMFTMWKHKPTGDIYMAADSGCSCPSPYEGFHGLKDLERATPDGIREWFGNHRKYGRGNAGDEAEALKVLEDNTPRLTFGKS